MLIAIRYTGNLSSYYIRLVFLFILLSSCIRIVIVSKTPKHVKTHCIGYKWELTTMNKICLSYALNLVNNDHTQGTTFHGLLVPVAHFIAIVASHWYAAPVVNRESINLCSHSVPQRDRPPSVFATTQ